MGGTLNYVVSEFVRFHPIVDNARWFGSCYDVSFVRYTVGTDLERSEDPLMEFSKSCRSRIRKALREGVTYRITVEPNNLDSFKPRTVQKKSNTCRGRLSEHYHCCRSLLCLWHYTPCSFVRYSSAVLISLSRLCTAIRSIIMGEREWFLPYSPWRRTD